MKYGIDKIGCCENEICPQCNWEGFRSELVKDYVYDNYEEENTLIDEHWVCPNCKSIVIE